MSSNFSKSSELLEIAEGLKALADHHRLQIISLLADGERCVCEIYQALELPQNLVSHHLKVLKEAGLVESRRDGTWMRYRLSQKRGRSSYGAMLEKAIKIAGEKRREKANGSQGSGTRVCQLSEPGEKR